MESQQEVQDLGEILEKAGLIQHEAAVREVCGDTLLEVIRCKRDKFMTLTEKGIAEEEVIRIYKVLHPNRKKAEGFRLYDVSAGEDKAREVAINTTEPIPFENDFFKGHFVLWHKCQNMPPSLETYFKKKKRKWEIRIQGKPKFKGNYEMLDQLFGVEAENPVDTSSWMLKLMTDGILSFIKMVGQSRGYLGFDYCLGSATEAPYAYWPMNQLHVIHIAKPGEPSPELTKLNQLKGFPYAERYEAMKYIDPECTYTISDWSMYVDLCSWSITNLPGLPWASISLSSFFPTYFNLRCFVRTKNEDGTIEGTKQFCAFRMENTLEDEDNFTDDESEEDGSGDET